MFNLLQKHTVELYDLKKKCYTQKNVKARSLLTADRFDLFAKLLYIKLRQSDKNTAINIYGKHIKAFNPDLKEPGRMDKNGLDDFVNAFDFLIEDFKNNEFNDAISVIPVSENGTILDGSHRVSALAFYDKELTILQFEKVIPVCSFDYLYFKKRGLPESISDRIAYEALAYLDNIFIACIWPKIGALNEREFTHNYLEKHFEILYKKQLTMTLNSLGKFIAEIYKEQDWVGDEHNGFKGANDKASHCYAMNGKVQFVFFKANSLEEVLQTKEEIRNHYNLGKHVIHITDNHQETIDIADLILTDKVTAYMNTKGLFSDKINNYKLLLKNYYWIKMKRLILKSLKVTGIYKLIKG